jgi:hypothetical protein
LGSTLREYNRYEPDFNLRIIGPSNGPICDSLQSAYAVR